LRVKVKYLARAREISGVREETIETDNHSTILDLLALLAEKHGEGMRGYLFDSATGKPHSYLQFLLDGRSVHTMNQFDTVLNDGATLLIVPPVSGG
jgi:molybdopterin synthase sulfur carrier subunit